MTTDELTLRVTERMRTLLAAEPSARNLVMALREVAKWRSALLEVHATRQGLTTLVTGPFAGMTYSVRATEGATLSRRIGNYEHSLAPVIEQIIARGYPQVIDIGSAEGYYAVGLARRMPGSRIFAHDGDARALRSCAALAEANDVADRVAIGGILTHADMDICTAAGTVVICDIEGAEVDLLDPVAAKGLLHADILVEVHEGMRPGALDLLRRRFEPSHDIRRIDRILDADALPDWAEQLSDMDRLLLLWEWRASPTPWLWMTRK